MPAKARDWVFTCNGVVQDAQAAVGLLGELRLRDPAVSRLRYVCLQLEVAPGTGRLHLQGYASFVNAVTLANARTHLDTFTGTRGTHVEQRRGTPSEAREYARKLETRLEGTQPVELGDLPRDTPGGRGRELDAAITTLESEGIAAVADQHPRVYILHHRGLAALAAARRRVAIEYSSVVLRPWQGELALVLDGPPHPRQVIWYFDLVGNHGKTWFANYIYDTCHNPDKFEIAILGNQKSADAAHSLVSPRIVFFDFTRSQEEQLNWSIIEQVKNGSVFSPKYDSGLKRFPTPHVVCFSNFDPAPYWDKLSADRWNIKEL